MRELSHAFQIAFTIFVFSRPSKFRGIIHNFLLLISTNFEAFL